MENELVEKNMGLVYYIARSFQKSTTGGIEYDDLVQEGMVGLVKAARAFDESKGFLSFGKLRIRARERFLKDSDAA